MSFSFFVSACSCVRNPVGLQRSFGVVLLTLAVLLVAAPGHADDSPEFSRQVVVNKARELSEKPFVAPDDEVPPELLELTYHKWRDIRYRPDKAVWHGKKSPYELQFFHPGLLYDRLVKINLVENGAVRPQPFRRDVFDYGSNHGLGERIPEKFGYAGLRVHGYLNSKTQLDEIAVFLGASYFRAVAQGQVYGLSARGLAINTALPEGEEFPYFKEFWIEQPRRSSKSLTVHALLDSPSLTGAYTFVIAGGKSTDMDVTATLFFRRTVEKVGIAPLNSMFLYGENTSPRTIDNFRPEIHDSDGMLLKLANGEWFWRPLDNPATLQIDAFQADNVQGFGLVQRDHDFKSYQDIEAQYERRPSLWVEPKGKWGHGHVELVRIPTQKEIHDNIVAFWTPEDTLKPGAPYTYQYSLSWYGGRFTHPPLGYVTATRTGATEKGDRRYVIDFESKALSLLNPPADVRGMISCGKGLSVVEQHVEKNVHTGGWRLSFVVRADETPSAIDRVLPTRSQPIDMRAFLRLNDTTLTETWNYAYQP